MIKEYFHQIDRLLEKVIEQEYSKMETAAEYISQYIQNDGIVYLFGCGHSHILTEEVFYRAGGLVPIKPIFHEPLMLHEGAMRSSMIERKKDYANTFMADQEITDRDVFIIISTSGRNPVPIDVALISKEKGAFVIGITSREYSNQEESRHPSGKRLYDVVDVVINNHAPVGDSILTHELVDQSFSPTSTVIGATILHAILSQAIVNMAKEGYEPPIFLSGNLAGSDEHNEKLVRKYEERIPLLTKGLS